jgi:hypothetical protein
MIIAMTTTLKVSTPDGKTQEFSTKAFGTAKETLARFKEIHKDSIQRLKWAVEIKSGPDRIEPAPPQA